MDKSNRGIKAKNDFWKWHDELQLIVQAGEELQ